MEILSPSQKLDKVLTALVYYHTNVPDRIAVLDEICEFLSNEISRTEMLLILAKLIKDEYAESDSSFMNITVYKITFDGSVFSESGGYYNKNIIDAQNETRIIRNEKLLVRGTWAAAIVAVLLLFWQVWVWIYPVHSDYPYWIWQTIPKNLK